MKNNDFFKYSGLGMEFAITVLFFVFLGLYLDKKFNTIPIFLLLGSLFGFISAIYLIYRTFLQMTASQQKDNTKSEKEDNTKGLK